jgi:hypothetical protein
MTPRGSVPPSIAWALAALAAFGLALSFAFVCVDYPIEWAEGRIFETARLLLAGTNPYCDIRKLPCADLTYPPFYAGLLSALGQVFGLTFATGRALSFASLLWVLFSLYRIARVHCDRRSALTAPAVFLLFIEACFFSASMRPDVLSMALILCAIDVLLRRPSVWGTASSAVLVLLGMFAKPQAFAAVLAICVYLVLVDRRRLAIFVAVGIAGGASIFGLGQILSGGRFLDHHLTFVISPTHTITQLGKTLSYGALPWAIVIAVALQYSVRLLRHRVKFVPLYLLASLAWGVATSASTGAAANYLFELYAATSLAVAGFLHASRERAPGTTAARLDRLAAAMLSVQVLLCLALNPWIGVERYLSTRKLWSARATLVPALRAAPEPILVEELPLAGYTGHQLFVNSYILTQLATMKLWDEAPLLELLRNRSFSRVVLREAPADDPNWLQRERFTPAMLEAISTHYRISWSDSNWFVYEPRTGAYLKGKGNSDRPIEVLAPKKTLAGAVEDGRDEYEGWDRP